MVEIFRVFTSPNVPMGGLAELSYTKMAPSWEDSWHTKENQGTTKGRKYGAETSKMKLSSVRSYVCLKILIAQGMKKD